MEIPNLAKETLQDVKLEFMKKQIFSIALVLTVFLGCSLNRNGSYTKTVFKTNGNKVIVTGTVYDTGKNNRTLPGVAIKSADTTLLTTTDRDGKYRIELQPGKNILRASYLGYRLASTKSLELVNGDSIVVDFIIKESHEKAIN